MTTQQLPSIHTTLVSLGLAPEVASTLTSALEAGIESGDLESAWRSISKTILRPDQPFEVHLKAHAALFANWDMATRPAPVWSPVPDEIDATNLAALMGDEEIDDYESLHRWSVEDVAGFWAELIDRLGIHFMTKPNRVIADDADVRTPDWLPGAMLNISDSCFNANADASAIIHAREDGTLNTMSYAKLDALTSRVANGLVEAGLEPGDAIAIDMLMTVESVAIYLGIVRAGCVAVSIADSFAPDEIATRLRIAETKAIFTNDFTLRGGKQLPLYEKICEANAPLAIVLPVDDEPGVALREGDLAWNDFLSNDDTFDAIPCTPGDHSNILFSSGTTGDPKAIPWSHTTPIKCAADGWLHQDIQNGDVVAWPTNLGWMMGPWLIYASLVNKATIALFESAPNTRAFCEFVQNARVTMLGVVPSLVKAWRMNNLVEGLDWSSIRCFSSTGECSNPEDMFWLMSRAGYKPVIEYCGGTEIGGGYITATTIQPATPATFTTPALGLDLVILDDQGNEATTGEVFLIPPSIGLSNKLLNRDHDEVYFQGTPGYPGSPEHPRGSDEKILRRHGDEIRRLGGGYFQAMGRADDTMNLGGIKISSAEIERVLNETDGVHETAAIAVPPPGGGPDQLIVYAVPDLGSTIDPETIQPLMQDSIKRHLNPLFRIHRVIILETLPRTASNKVMRRTLRTDYQLSQ